MTQYKKTELVIDKTFDAASSRHQVDGDTVVLHCHHYTALYTQLAMDCSLLDAKALLADCSEEVWHDFLQRYYAQHNISGLADRIAIAEQTYAAIGMGSLRVTCAGRESGEVCLDHSHVDTGWLKKWGAYDQPVNYIGAGYIAGLFAAVFDQPVGTFIARETQSIVCGSERSVFNVVTR